MSKDNTFLIRSPAHVWFANVFQPREGAGSTAEDKKLQYDCMLVWGKDDADLSDLRKRLVAAGKDRWGEKPKCKYALKDGDKLDDDAALAEALAGKWYMNVGSKYKPPIVDGKKRPIETEDEFYSGCWAIACVHIYTTDHEQGGRRVSVGLDALQRTGKGEPLGGGGVDTDDVFDEFEEEHEEGWEPGSGAASDELEEDEDDPFS